MIHGLFFLHGHFFQCRQHGGVHARCLLGRVLGKSLGEKSLVPNRTETHRRESLFCLHCYCHFQKCHGIPQGLPVTRPSEPNLEVLEKLFEGRRKSDVVVFPCPFQESPDCPNLTSQCGDSSPCAKQGSVSRLRPESFSHGSWRLSQEAKRLTHLTLSASSVWWFGHRSGGP